MTEDLIKAEDLARELGVDVADLFERALLGAMPSPCWRRDEVVAWIAAYRGPTKGGRANE